MKNIALAVLIAALAGPVLAQEAPASPTPAAPAPAAPARWNGLPVADITARLLAAGLTVAPPRTNADRVYLLVDDGPVRWVMTLFSCTDGACPDVQFTAVFSGPNATPEIVARWNGDRRFVKAFHALPEVEGGEGQAVAQFDVLLSEGGGAAQLDDPIQVWRSLSLDLGRTVNPGPN
ncbi:YbjN domain-containing protein [Brevundimonas sp. R86498]|uniref:YbjN domain-containing protein n=1 Tax=Brevundimonas sp. R86498 TaxID=3093845 RepID=UPI0037C6CE20